MARPADASLQRRPAQPMKATTPWWSQTSLARSDQRTRPTLGGAAGECLYPGRLHNAAASVPLLLLDADELQPGPPVTRWSSFSTELGTTRLRSPTRMALQISLRKSVDLLPGKQERIRPLCSGQLSGLVKVAGLYATG